MKFAAREGDAARTFASTTRPSRLLSAPGHHAAQSAEGLRASDAANRVRGDINSPAQRSRATSPSAVSFARGQRVFTPGQGQGLVYIVRTGCVRLYKMLPDGRSINVGLLGPNTVFTQEVAGEGIASGSIAEALVESTVSIVEADALASIIAGSPELAAAAVNGMSRRLTELQTLVEHLLVRDTAVRLAATLDALANRLGRPTADGLTVIALSLTHQSLANMIGSNRVTVTRKLLALQEHGCVKSLGRNTLAVSQTKLREYMLTSGDGNR